MKLRLHGLLRDLPPGPGSFPYIDWRLARDIHRNPIGTLMELYDEYGPAFTIRFLGLEMVFLIGPEANQKILVDDYRDFSWREGLYGDLIPFIGDGLLTTDDEAHDRARELLGPAFHPKRIRSYGERMIERAVEATDQLEPGRDLELHQWTRQTALKIAGDVLIGMQMPEDRAEFFAEHFEKGLDFYGGRYTQTLFLPEFGKRYHDMKRHVEVLDEAIYDEIEWRRRWGTDGDSILDVLIEAEKDGEQFSDEEVRDHLLTLLFAGHDTTAATVSWLFSLIGRHREVYRRLQREIDETFGDAPPTTDVLMDECPYLDKVVKETLRLYPAAWFGPRMARKDFSIYGYDIPAGTNVAYSSWMTHRMPEIWDDPDAFDPERFEDDNFRQIDPAAYVPFGRGPRTCIGMQFGRLEVKVLTSVLMQRYRFELFPGQSFEARTVPTISPRHGVKLRVRERDR